MAIVSLFAMGTIVVTSSFLGYIFGWERGYETCDEANEIINRQG